MYHHSLITYQSSFGADEYVQVRPKNTKQISDIKNFKAMTIDVVYIGWLVGLLGFMAYQPL